jgi:hypothetical protein
MPKRIRRYDVTPAERPTPEGRRLWYIRDRRAGRLAGGPFQNEVTARRRRDELERAERKEPYRG